MKPARAGLGRTRLLAALLCLVAACALAAPDTAAPLVFFGDRDLAPYEFLEDGQPQGASVDLAHAIGRELGRPVEVRLMAWNEAQRRLLAGEGHALTRMGRTSEREARFGFSHPTFAGAYALFVRAGDEDRFDPRNLAGKRVGVVEAGLPRQVLSEKHPSATLVLVEHQADGTRRLLRGEIDALAAPVWAQLHLMKKMDLGGITQLPPFLTDLGHIAVRRGDSALLADIDTALLRLQAQGEIERISDRWSRQRVYLFSNFSVRMGQVAAGVAALALAALALATWLLMRQRQQLRYQIRVCREAEDAARGSEQRTQRLQQLTAGLAAADTPEEVGALVARHGPEWLGAPQILVAELVRGGRQWQVLGSAGSAEHAQRVPSGSDVPLTAALAQDEPLVFESRAAALAAHPQWLALWQDNAQQAGYLAVLRAGGASGQAATAIGGLSLGWAESHAFGDEEREQLAAVTTLVAQALERTQLRRSERRAAARQAVLQAMGAELSNVRTVLEACAVVTATGLREINAAHSGVALFDEPPPPQQAPLPGAMLSMVQTANMPAELAARFAHFSADAGMSLALAARTGQAVLLGTRAEMEATAPDVCKVPDADHVQALAGLPLQAPVAAHAAPQSMAPGPSRLGALLFAFAEPRDFEADERSFLEALANMAARAIERCQLLARLQTSLDNSEAERRQLDALVEQFPVGVIMVAAPSGRLLRASREVARIVGRSPTDGDRGDAVGGLDLGWPAFRPGQSEPLRADEWPLAQALAHGQVTAMQTLEFGRPDGTRRTVECQATPIHDGNGRLFAAAMLFIDVSEQLAANQRQREAELRLRLALDSAGMGSWDQDPRTGQVWWSPRMYALLGLAEGDGHETPESLLQRVLAEDRAAVEADMRRAAAEETDFDVTFRIRRGDGELRWLLGRGRLLRNAGGAADRMLGINFDITPIMQARQELEAADRQKDEFLAMLSHELRNPLAPIVNAAEVLVRAGDRADMRGPAVQVIQRQARQLARLVDDLLEVSRIRHGRIDLKLQALDLSRQIDTALDTVRPMLERQHHSLSLRLPAQAQWVYADPGRLTQMLVNMVGNAVKYTQAEGHIEVSAASDGDFAVLSVRDNGLGIAPEFLPRVFDLFAQAGGTRDRAEGGLGIGLALVKRLAEMHGGSIEVSSAGLGCGTCFTLRLPLARNRPSEDEPPLP